jgi:DNA-binding FrmR family transcriptional regulator/copper chaperone CopZ
MDETTRNILVLRLASAAGHLKGIERMVKDDAHCPDVIQQIQAVQAALHKASLMALHSHLQTCLATAIGDVDASAREGMLQDLTAVFNISNKLNLSSRRFQPMNNKSFTVPNISCGHCVHTIETEVGEIAGVVHVKASQETKQVTVEWENPASWAQIQATLQKKPVKPTRFSGGMVQLRSPQV